MMTHDVLGVRIDDISIDEVRQRCLGWLKEQGTKVIVTPNPEFLVLAQRSKEFQQLLHTADLALPDGVGLRFAVSALLDTRLRHRTTGVDALKMLRELAEQHGKKLLLVGNDTADIDAGRIQGGVGDARLSPEVIERIRAAAPDIVAFGLGQGKQETIMQRHKTDWPSVKIMIGVGGAIEMLSGRQRRAPAWLQKLGLEWLWRFVTQPKRWRRIGNALVVFPVIVAWTTLRQHRFLKAATSTIPEVFRQLTGR